LLLWSADQLDDQLDGFSISRQLKRGKAAQQTGWLDNYGPPGPKTYR